MSEEKPTDTQQPDAPQGEKAKLDDDDILAELGISGDKAELDVDGLRDIDVFDDRAVLDTEGLPEGDFAGNELEPPPAAPGADADSPGAAAAEASALPGENRFAAWCEKLRCVVRTNRFAVVAGGAALLCCLVLSALFFFFIAGSDEPHDDVTQEDPISEAGPVGAVGPQTVKLAPFLIELAGRENDPAFVRLQVEITFAAAPPGGVDAHMKQIRITVFNVLSAKSRDDFVAERALENVCEDIKQYVNHDLHKTVVKEVSLSDVSLL